MVKYTLYKGFKKLGVYFSIIDAKKLCPKEDGVYNLISSDKMYRDSWMIINGVLYND